MKEIELFMAWKKGKALLEEMLKNWIKSKEEIKSKSKKKLIRHKLIIYLLGGKKKDLGQRYILFNWMMQSNLNY